MYTCGFCITSVVLWLWLNAVTRFEFRGLNKQLRRFACLDIHVTTSVVDW